MNNHILFIHGGGEGGHEADKSLAASLKMCLGSDYEIDYPEMKSDDAASDFGWTKQIGNHIYAAKKNVIIVAHSFGASMLLKYLSENPVHKKVGGIFLLATPFWSGNEEWQQGLKLHEDFAGNLPAHVPLFFYHCEDDEEIAVGHLDHYRKKVPQATFQMLTTGGHQFNNDLTQIARDIKALE